MMAEEDEFLMDSDTEEEDRVMHPKEDEEEEEEDIDNSDDSDFDPISFGIAERIRQARPLDEEDSGEEEEGPAAYTAYMADSFRDLPVAREIAEVFRYIEDYKPVHLDLEDSGKLAGFLRLIHSNSEAAPRLLLKCS